MNRTLELLPILYALLAAITGIHADDRSSARAERPVAAIAAAPCAAEEARFAAVARIIAPRPAVSMPALSALAKVRPLARIAPARLFAVAGFAVRRE